MHEIAESPNQLVTVEKWPKFHCAKQNLREWVKKGFPHDNASLHSHWLYTINYFAVARSKLFLDFTEKTFSAVQTNKVRRHTYIHVYTRDDRESIFTFAFLPISTFMILEYCRSSEKIEIMSKLSLSEV